MKYHTLDRDLTVSAVGLGCMGMSHAYGAPADKKEMTELLVQAVDMGYTFFDTAEVYGTPDNPHDNEELVGAALKPYRDKIVLATKFGIHFDMTSTAVNKPLVPDFRPEVIRASVDASLKRLGTDHSGTPSYVIGASQVPEQNPLFQSRKRNILTGLWGEMFRFLFWRIYEQNFADRH